VTDAKGQTFYQAEVHGKDIVFTEKGGFCKSRKIEEDGDRRHPLFL